jgi:regulator of sirC expression with transglutaminase-like and TPR domain
VQENNEIKALLNLIDDPDEVVFDSVSNKLISFGKSIIPNLEHLWESETNHFTQERIELLIHKLHFNDLCKDFELWAKENGELLKGAILIAKYHYPTLQENLVLQEIEKLRRNIWLELNNYLTPMEKISVLNSIFFNYYNQNGVAINYENPAEFIINKSLENKIGNVFSNGIIYLILCELLDIPVQGVSIPNQFLLAYFDDFFVQPNPSTHPSQKILFYIDPLNGKMYSNKDVENYLKKIDTTTDVNFFRPNNSKKIIQQLITELIKCYDNDNNRHKIEELQLLSKLLDR